MNVRDKISAAYWGAVDRVGPLVPTPQVIGSGLAAIVVGLLDRYAIDLSVVGIDSSVVVGAIALGVAYLIGPEKPTVGKPPAALRLHVVNNTLTDEEPVDGKFYGAEDDPAKPGTGIV